MIRPGGMPSSAALLLFAINANLIIIRSLILFPSSPCQLQAEIGELIIGICLEPYIFPWGVRLSCSKIIP